MAKKKAIIAIEFEDDEDDIMDCSDLATVATIALERSGFKGLDVTVYSTPEALAADSADGYGPFAAGREDAPEALPLAQEASVPSA